MADPPKTGSKLESEANDRLKECRRWKAVRQVDISECYFFAAPHRIRWPSSQSAPPTTSPQDADVLQTSEGFLLSGDFITEIVNTYMPEAQPWCERGPGTDVPTEIFQQVAEQVRKDDKKIFEAIKASNLYSELPKAFDPDISIGTAALWVDRRYPSAPISALAIPLRELEVNLGPDGEIDDRWAIRWTQNCYVKTLLRGVTLPKEVAEDIEKNPAKKTEIRWGFWRDWDVESDEVWKRLVMIGDTLVDDGELRGEGSCPLLPMRFNPTADWPFGIGPLIKGLPDLRQVDEMAGRTIEAVDRNINSPITFPDDSFAAVEQGLESGAAYPIRPGTADDVKPIYEQVQIDSAILMDDRMSHRLRKLFYIDFPEQSGDTPPTLGQWLDELARAQRRIGTPGLSFWREGPAKIFLRYKYLLERAGTIQQIKVDGRGVSLMPRNPTQRASEQQDIATAMQFLQIAAQAFPEEYRAIIDGAATMEAFLKTMRVTDLVKVRPPDKQKQAVALIAQLMAGGQQAGASPAEGAGAPAAT